MVAPVRLRRLLSPPALSRERFLFQSRRSQGSKIVDPFPPIVSAPVRVWCLPGISRLSPPLLLLPSAVFQLVRAAHLWLRASGRFCSVHHCFARPSAAPEFAPHWR